MGRSSLFTKSRFGMSCCRVTAGRGGGCQGGYRGACNCSVAVMVVCDLTQAHTGAEPALAAAGASSMGFACSHHQVSTLLHCLCCGLHAVMQKHRNHKLMPFLEFLAHIIASCVVFQVIICWWHYDTDRLSPTFCYCLTQKAHCTALSHRRSTRAEMQTYGRAQWSDLSICRWVWGWQARLRQSACLLACQVSQGHHSLQGGCCPPWL